MPGTILSSSGLLGRLSPYEELLPNRVIRLDYFAEEKYLPSGIEAVRSRIEHGLSEKQIIEQSLKMTYGVDMPKLPPPEGRRAIRVMMTRYWDNASPFALDLVGAVMRQGTFVKKMHNIDWLHSPAMKATMHRLVLKYLRFWRLLKDKKHMAVPTLDVDLGWHTHQLSPLAYYTYSIYSTSDGAFRDNPAVNARFVDHDDKVAEAALNDAFTWTSKEYQRLFNEPYSECTCWYCEAIRESAAPSSVSRLFGRSKDDDKDKTVSFESNPAKSPHISAHNAIRPSVQTEQYKTVQYQAAVRLLRDYEKAAKRAAKKGRKPPPKPVFGDKGTAMYTEGNYALYPFFAAPLIVTPGLYPASAECGSGVARCATGTCGAGGFAAGSCGSWATGGFGSCTGGGGADGGCSGCGGCGGVWWIGMRQCPASSLSTL